MLHVGRVGDCLDLRLVTWALFKAKHVKRKNGDDCRVLLKRFMFILIHLCSDADIMRAKQEKAAQKKADGDVAQAGTSKGK